MPEEDTIFSSSVKYKGIFKLSDFYKFCHTWLTEETNLLISENKYEEKLSGNMKEVIIEWTGEKKLTDYFKFKAKVEFTIRELTNVEVVKEGVKVSMNKGSVETKVKGILVKDYEGKFERSASSKFFRSLYEKWIIPSRIREFEERVLTGCDKFLAQVKAFLDLEGKK